MSESCLGRRLYSHAASRDANSSPKSLLISPARPSKCLAENTLALTANAPETLRAGNPTVSSLELLYRSCNAIPKSKSIARC